MTEPTTSNIGLIVPNTGDLVNLWGTQAVNPNMQTVDGYQGGLLALGVSTGNVVLTVPAAYTATPSAGPTQAQNALIRLSGALTGNVTVFFPLPGYYIIENNCTNTGNFFVALGAGTGTPVGNLIGAVPNKKCHVFNDGTNMDYVNMPDPGTAYDLHGAITYPTWMNACTVKPYLIKDGTQYATATYPGLFAAIGYSFGGSGANFNVPDERARARIAFDPNGTNRLTNAVSGITGTTMGSAGGDQSTQAHTHNIPGLSFSTNQTNVVTYSGGISTINPTPGPGVVFLNNFGQVQLNGTTSGGTSGSSGNGGSQNVQPSIVSFLPLIKT